MRAVASSASASASRRRRWCGRRAHQRRVVRILEGHAAARPLPDERRGSARAASRRAARTSAHADACRRAAAGRAIRPSLEARRLLRAEAVAAVVRCARVGGADELPRPLHLHEHGRVAPGVGVRLAQAQPEGLAQRLLVGGRGRPRAPRMPRPTADCRTRALPDRSAPRLRRGFRLCHRVARAAPLSGARSAARRRRRCGWTARAGPGCRDSATRRSPRA